MFSPFSEQNSSNSESVGGAKPLGGSAAPLPLLDLSLFNLTSPNLTWVSIWFTIGVPLVSIWFTAGTPMVSMAFPPCKRTRSPLYLLSEYRSCRMVLFVFQSVMYAIKSSLSRIVTKPLETSTRRSSSFAAVVRMTEKASTIPSSSACIPRS